MISTEFEAIGCKRHHKFDGDYASSDAITEYFADYLKMLDWVTEEIRVLVGWIQFVYASYFSSNFIFLTVQSSKKN